MESLARLRARGHVEESVLLGPLTTYKFGGPARYLVTVDDEEDLRDGWEVATSERIPVVALGRGSNVVVADAGFDGVVFRAGPGLSHRSFGPTVVAGAAVPLPILARESVREGWGGLEFFVGIPGSVGGAVRMNAGCHGTETRDVLVTARVFDGATGTVDERTADDLGLRYRHSDLGDTHFVLSATFSAVPREPEIGETEMRAITQWRKEHQPGGTFNAGSVFKNPPGDAAGRLVDAAGLKGYRVGGVSVSERHANFFVADDDATAADVAALVARVRSLVRSSSGVDLEPEIRFIGDFGPTRDGSA